MKRHRLISYIVAALLLFSFPPKAAHALQDSLVSDCDIPVITVANDEEAESLLDSSSAYTPEAVAISVRPVIIRSGVSEHCELYLQWSSADMINSFRAKNIRISAQGLLNPTQYASWGDGSNYRYYGFTAANSGSKRVGGFSLPTNISTVRFTATDFQAYDMRLLMWVSSSISKPVSVD